MHTALKTQNDNCNFRYCICWIQWCIPLRITGFIDFVHHQELYIVRKHNVSETGLVSIFGEERETPPLLDPLERDNLGYWTTHAHRSRSHIMTDGQSASSSWCLALFGAGDQMLHLFWLTITLFIFHVGRPLWREDWSVICSAMTQVQFQVKLQPTVCRPVRIDAGPPMEPITRF
jgi:hypothetical protein